MSRILALLTLIGILLAIIFGTLQNKFKFLSISESVYFMNYLPIDIEVKYIFSGIWKSLKSSL